MQLCCSKRVQWHFCRFRARWFSISIMNFKKTFLRGDLWIKNVNYFLGISVQSFARTKTVYALFYTCPELGHCPQLGHLLIQHDIDATMVVCDCECESVCFIPSRLRPGAKLHSAIEETLSLFPFFSPFLISPCMIHHWVWLCLRLCLWTVTESETVWPDDEGDAEPEAEGG